MAEDDAAGPASLLPYGEWTEAALRGVVSRALEHAGREGLPGEHHFYITFRTDHPATVMPTWLREKYPDEMTIVLQNKFWDLKMDEAAGEFSVGLTFGGVPTTLRVPLTAVTAFADPHVRFGLRFRPEMPEPAPAAVPEPGDDASPAEVVSLDAFRRRPASKE